MQTLVKLICPYCKVEFDVPLGRRNASIKGNWNIYCCPEHSGLGRRQNKTQEQKKKEKAEYDKVYRDLNEETLKTKKQAYSKTPAGRAMQKRNRDKFKQHHLDYIRQPAYKEWKKKYDLLHQAKKTFGEYAEAALILEKITGLIDNREAVKQKGTYNKPQKRKRAWLRTRKSNLMPLP